MFRSVLDAVYERVKAGAALSDAFEEHGTLFPRVYTASLMAGERSGSLEVVLRRYVSYTKLAGAVRRKTLSALIYPAVLVSLAMVVVGIIVLKLVPAFSEFYASFHAELPLVDADHRAGLDGVERAHRARRWAGSSSQGRPQPVGATASGADAARSHPAEPAVGRATWRGSLRSPSWRARSPRCSAAAFRS